MSTITVVTVDAGGNVPPRSASPANSLDAGTA